MNVSAEPDSAAFLPGKVTHSGALMLFQEHTGDSSFFEKFYIGGACLCSQQEFEIAGGYPSGIREAALTAFLRSVCTDGNMA